MGIAKRNHGRDPFVCLVDDFFAVSTMVNHHEKPPFGEQFLFFQTTQQANLRIQVVVWGWEGIHAWLIFTKILQRWIWVPPVERHFFKAMQPRRCTYCTQKTHQTKCMTNRPTAESLLLLLCESPLLKKNTKKKHHFYPSTDQAPYISDPSKKMMIPISPAAFFQGSKVPVATQPNPLTETMKCVAQVHCM